MREVEISNEAYDIIGDIHGHADELEALLQGLGYVETNGTYGSPSGRKVVFLGDYIDRGPKVRRSLEIVRAMIDSGTALGIMGNHELNALRYHTKDSNGHFMRAHYGSKLAQHAATLDQFGKTHSAELLDYVEWFSTLPLTLDLGGIRVAHACWHPVKIELVRALGPLSGAMLEACSQKGTEVFDAIDTLLCGLEAKLPEGESFETADGQKRNDIRIRWWESPDSIQRNDQYVFPPDPRIHPSLIQHYPDLPGFTADAPLTFFGHYAILNQEIKALKPNLACLDYGMGKGGHLVAYSWDGERQIDSSKFTAIPQGVGSKA